MKRHLAFWLMILASVFVTSLGMSVGLGGGTDQKEAPPDGSSVVTISVDKLAGILLVGLGSLSTLGTSYLGAHRAGVKRAKAQLRITAESVVCLRLVSRKLGISPDEIDRAIDDAVTRLGADP